MEKEEFEKLAPEQQFSVIIFYLNMMKDAIYTRMSLLPSICALFATFLTVATFDRKMLPLDGTLRIILCILIFFIPLSLYIYNSDLKKSEQISRKSIDNWLGKTEVDSTFQDKIHSYFPDILIFVFIVISLVIIYKILAVYNF